MELSGKRVVASPREDLFPRLLDPKILAACIPGCEELVQNGEGGYRVRLSVGLGPIKTAFQGTVALTDVVAPQGYTMHLRGQGRAGSVNGTTRVTLRPVGDRATEIGFQSDFELTGLIGGLGSRLLPGAARSLADRFFESLEKALREGPA